MDINTVKNEIKKNDVALAGNMNNLSSLRNKIIIEIKPFVASELVTLVEREVSRNSRHTKSLTKAKLAEMKRKFNKILESNNETVDRIFADDKLWMYMDYRAITEATTEQVLEQGTRADDNIIDGIRIALGQAGQLLIDYGYEEVEETNLRHADYVLNDYIIFDNTTIAYRSEMILPRTLTDLIKEYCQVVRSLHVVLKKDLKLKKQITEKEALDLWIEV